MTYRALVSLVVLLMAGCMAPADSPRGQGAVPTVPGFTAPVSLGGGAATETFLAVGADGLVLACSHGGFSGPSLFWISHDDGTSWTAVTPGPNPIPDGDCDVEVSPEGELAIVYDYAAGASIAVSRDGGESWTIDHAVAPPLTGVVDRPWIAYVGDRLLLSYKALGQGPGIVMARASDDHGATWSAPTLVSAVDDARRANQLSLDFLVGADGLVRVPLVSYDNDPSVDEAFRFAVSRDRGASWTVEPAVGPLPADILAAAAVAGNGSTLYWAWYDKAGTLLTARSIDSGSTWDEPVTVARAKTVWTPAIAGRPDGGAAIVWMQSGPDQPMASILANGTATAPILLEPPSAATQSAEFSDVVVGPDALARAVYGWDPGDGSCSDLGHPMGKVCIHYVRQSS